MLSGFMMIQCDDGDSPDGGVIFCVVHEDCPDYFSCIESLGICGTHTVTPGECVNDNNCVIGYKCQKEPNEIGGKCIPDPDYEEIPECVTPCTIGGEDCNEDTEICYNACCTLLNAPCPNGVSDCLPNQICVDNATGTLVCYDGV